MFYDNKYKISDFGHFQAFHSTKITTKTSNGHLIFCFQDRMLKFCMKAYLTNLNPWLRGIFDIPTFSFFGIVLKASIVIISFVLFPFVCQLKTRNWLKSSTLLLITQKETHTLLKSPSYSCLSSVTFVKTKLVIQ